MKLHSAVLILAACAGGTAPPPRAPAEPAKSHAPTPEAGGLGCTEPCELTNHEAPPAPGEPPPPDEPPAPPIWERISVTNGPVPGLAGYSVELVDAAGFCGGKQLITTRNKQRKTAKAEQTLAALFAIEYPRGLDLTPNTEVERTASSVLQSWLDTYFAVFRTARLHYEDDVRDKDLRVQVVAHARIHQASLRFAAGIAFAEIPKGFVNEEVAVSFCDLMSRAADPWLADADRAKAACTEKAKLVGSSEATGWWAPICTQ